MAFNSTLQFRRRASRRIIHDTPLDLEEMGLDDPLALLSGKIREVIERQQQFERGKAPFDRRARFGIPASPASSRLRSADGLESFHLAINKTRERSAAVFDRYATRDVALIAGTAAADRAADGRDAALPERSAPMFDEYAMGHGRSEHEAPLFITTLDPRADVRRGQWDQIESHERAQRRNPGSGPPRINLRFAQAPDLLTTAALHNECPTGLRDAILAERDRVAAERELPIRQRRDGVPWISSDAPRAMAWLESLPGWAVPVRGQQPAAKLSMGRGTPTVIAGEIELPRGLDEAGHRNIMIGLGNFIQHQARDSAEKGQDGEPAFQRATIPFMVVRHNPDALNNPLNDHLHFQQGTRLVQAGPGGQLIFATHKVEAIAKRDWIKRLRCEAARLMNVELERIGADYRLSPQTYAAMGIDAATQTKLHGDRVVLERAGVPTDTGIVNIAEAWRRRFEQVRRDHDDALVELRRRDRDVADRVRTLDDKVKRRLNAEQLAARVEEERALHLRFEAAEIAILIDMARSRSEQTTRFAGAYATKAMQPTGRENYAAMRWRQRGADAEAYLAELDVELAGERGAIAEREREASIAEKLARDRWQRIDEAVRLRGASENKGHAALTSRQLTPAGAATLAVNTPVYITRIGNQFSVRPEDDPSGALLGIDLSSQANRLRGVHAAQEKELAQLRAYVRRHGKAGVADQALGGTSEWLQRSARKWRDSAVFARMTRADQGLAKTFADFTARSDDIGPPLLELPDEVPTIDDSADPALLARYRVLFVPVRKPLGRPVATDLTTARVPAVEADGSVALVRIAGEVPSRAQLSSQLASRSVPDRVRDDHDQTDQPDPPAKVTAARVAIPDGFGGFRDDEPPDFISSPIMARVIPFDSKTGAPTKPLLTLLAFAGRNPRQMVFASDDRLTTLPGTPKLVEPLIRMWRDDDAVQALIVQTVTASRAAGRPVWPEHLASRIRALEPSPVPIPRDWSDGITR